MEGLVSTGSEFWSGRSVLVTGHTGFKGSWLAIWLETLGAEVHGFALDPPSSPSLFRCADVQNLLKSDCRSDIRNPSDLEEVVRTVRPQVILHLAAQPLVATGFDDPWETWSVNVLGTVNLLDVVRRLEQPVAVVVVTTDKVYEDQGPDIRYVETDRLGGLDPYSASKTATELVAASFLAGRSAQAGKGNFRIATARAGNVIGGGDWSENRLLPDCLRAFAQGDQVVLRMPEAVRPWQHVLEPLDGYLRLAQELCGSEGERYSSAWNFGPDSESELTVAQVAEMAATAWGTPASVATEPVRSATSETQSLKLDSTKARGKLGWLPQWEINYAVEQTVAWQKDWIAGGSMLEVCRRQIAEYLESR